VFSAKCPTFLQGPINSATDSCSCVPWGLVCRFFLREDCCRNPAPYHGGTPQWTRYLSRAAMSRSLVQTLRGATRKALLGPGLEHHASPGHTFTCVSPLGSPVHRGQGRGRSNGASCGQWATSAGTEECRYLCILPQSFCFASVQFLKDTPLFRLGRFLEPYFCHDRSPVTCSCL
jgi:hypothetical protein